MSQPETPHGSAWLAQDLTAYPADTAPWDVVVVGSGYGGAVAAHTFSQRTSPDGGPLRVLLLERGGEYVPGAFPSTLDELPSHVRIARGGRSLIGRPAALFDLRLGDGVHALVGNGLGGGSLINGAVMVAPDFAQCGPAWPASLVTSLTQAHGFLDRARRLLGGADPQNTPNTIGQHTLHQRFGTLPKAKALQSLQAPALPCEPVPLTIAMKARDGLVLCSLCGDCLTGCNVGARASLDVQLLAQAVRGGTQAFCHASVLRLQRDGQLWSLSVVHTDPKVQRRRTEPLLIRAHKVVLAAGSFGSTEILLRSCAQQGGADHHTALRFSGLLGKRFSANGDNLMAIELPDRETQLVGAEHTPLTAPSGLSPRGVGPQITHELRFAPDGKQPGFRVQEFAVPAALKPLWEEIVTTRGLAEALVSGEGEHHRPLKPGENDPLAVDEERLRRTLLVGLIGHDSATGVLTLPANARAEGQIRLAWKDAAQDPAMRAAYGCLTERVQQIGGRVIPNPVWQTLPQALEFIAGQGVGNVTTVHPLGGCPLGEHPHSGVVNPEGAVFDVGDGTTDGRGGWFGSLLVLDGAIVPTSLGANPALTIAALSLRAAEHWADQWGWRSASGAHPKPLAQRPRLRPPEQCTPATPPAPTRFQIIERLTSHHDGGGASLVWRRPDRTHRVVVELTFAFEPQDLHSLTTPGHKHLHTAAAQADLPGVNLLRLYDQQDWETHHLHLADDHVRHQRAKVVAVIKGGMDMLLREPGWAAWHRSRYVWALASNRLSRDVWRLLGEIWKDPGVSAWSRSSMAAQVLRQIWRLSNPASEVRRLNYTAEVVELWPLDPAWADVLRVGDPVRGHKRLLYQARENPWNQLLYLQLEPPGRLSVASGCGEPGHRLKLDARFLAERGLPLVRVTEQSSQVRALVEGARWGLYLLRLLLKLHAVHLRTPDPPPAGQPQRLPGAITGLPVPEIIELDLEPTASPQRPDAARVRLTRYRNPSTPGQPPLVLIHGYSASGTSFAHELLQPGMARHFWLRGRDIWVLDLRTSSGMPSRRRPWTFEQVAQADIPLAIDHIARQVARERAERVEAVQVDVFAHCIGAVMVSMALLGDAPPSPPLNHTALKDLQARVRRLALSQKGFVVEYRDANVLRAYLLQQFKALLTDGYHFRPSTFPSLGERLYDAFLATLPYPPAEWKKEHPWWSATPWAATRRRMDALYERTFNIANIPDTVLHRIDDFFGSLHLETVSQTIHFARMGTITDRTGRNAFASPTRLAARWPTGGTLLISSAENGMVDPHSSLSMLDQLVRAGFVEGQNVWRELIPGGHQDALIGHHTVQSELLKHLDGFFQCPPLPLNPDLMRAPWRGPRLGGVGLAQIMRDPAAADESVLGFPVRWRSDAAPRVMLGDPPVVLEQSLSNDVAWQSIPMPPLPKGATGYVLFTSLGWRPFHGTPYSGRPAQPLALMNPALQALGVSTPTQRTPIAPPPAARHTAAALQILVDRVFEHQPQVLHRAYLPASPASAQTLAPGGQNAAMLRPQPLCFAFASCQYPAGVFDARPAQASLQRLADRCLDAAQSAPQCVLFIGDQIYADATLGLLDAARLDDRLHAAYAQWLGMKPLRDIMARVPVHGMLDDHEIEDNWEPAVAPNLPGQDVLADGLKAFLEHQCPELLAPGAPKRLWRTVTLGAGHEVFMLDTRTERDPRPWAPGVSSPQIMGPAQRDALQDWLRTTHSPVRWIASPVWLLPRPLGRPDTNGHPTPLDPALCDSWPGYPASLDELLGLLAREHIEHVVLLCGDAHLAGHTVLSLRRAQHPGKTLRVDVLHCPALYAPFPFANAQPHQFLLSDTLSGGTGNNPWHCTVHSTLWPAGDGFISVSVDPANNRITAAFDTPSPRTVQIP